MQLCSNVIIYLIYWVYLDDMNYEYEYDNMVVAGCMNELCLKHHLLPYSNYHEKYSTCNFPR